MLIKRDFHVTSHIIQIFYTPVHWCTFGTLHVSQPASQSASPQNALRSSDYVHVWWKPAWLCLACSALHGFVSPLVERWQVQFARHARRVMGKPSGVFVWKSKEWVCVYTRIPRSVFRVLFLQVPLSWSLKRDCTFMSWLLVSLWFIRSHGRKFRYMSPFPRLCLVLVYNLVVCYEYISWQLL